MSNLHFNQSYFKALQYLVVVFLLIFCFLIQPAHANDTSHNPGEKSLSGNRTIHITSDRLISNNKAGYAEFIGHVKAIQGDTVITSDKLKIFFKKNTKNKFNRKKHYPISLKFCK